MACEPIYGFSGKVSYDTFLTNSQLALKPYPLVKGYLRNQTGVPSDELKIVVVDAAGPRDPHLRAVTLEAVLEAQENRTTHVTAAYQLTFVQNANAYSLEESTR
jgi:hypothetical protein